MIAWLGGQRTRSTTNFDDVNSIEDELHDQRGAGDGTAARGDAKSGTATRGKARPGAAARDDAKSGTAARDVAEQVTAGRDAKSGTAARDGSGQVTAARDDAKSGTATRDVARQGTAARDDAKSGKEGFCECDDKYGDHMKDQMYKGKGRYGDGRKDGHCRGKGKYDNEHKDEPGECGDKGGFAGASGSGDRPPSQGKASEPGKKRTGRRPRGCACPLGASVVHSLAREILVGARELFVGTLTALTSDKRASLPPFPRPGLGCLSHPARIPKCQWNSGEIGEVESQPGARKFVICEPGAHHV